MTYFLLYRQLDYLQTDMELKEFSSKTEMADWLEVYGNGHEIVKTIEGREMGRLEMESNALTDWRSDQI